MLMQGAYGLTLANNSLTGTLPSAWTGIWVRSCRACSYDCLLCNFTCIASKPHAVYMLTLVQIRSDCSCGSPQQQVVNMHIEQAGWTDAKLTVVCCPRIEVCANTHVKTGIAEYGVIADGTSSAPEQPSYGDPTGHMGQEQRRSFEVLHRQHVVHVTVLLTYLHCGDYPIIGCTVGIACSHVDSHLSFHRPVAIT